MTAAWYARYVNGHLRGIESLRQAEAWARASISTGSLDTAVRWTDHDPGDRGLTRRWVLEPITDQQAANWRAYGVLDYEGD